MSIIVIHRDYRPNPNPNPNYSDSFSRISGQNSSENTIVFLRAFRTYSVSPRDIVLIKEDELV
jgi:hypothetical protein